MAENSIAASVDLKFTYVYLPVIIFCIIGAVSNVLLLVAFIAGPLKCFRNSGTYLCHSRVDNIAREKCEDHCKDQ